MLYIYNFQHSKCKLIISNYHSPWVICSPTRVTMSTAHTKSNGTYPIYDLKWYTLPSHPLPNPLTKLMDPIRACLCACAYVWVRLCLPTKTALFDNHPIHSRTMRASKLARSRLLKQTYWTYVKSVSERINLHARSHAHTHTLRAQARARTQTYIHKFEGVPYYPGLINLKSLDSLPPKSFASPSRCLRASANRKRKSKSVAAIANRRRHCGRHHCCRCRRRHHQPSSQPASQRSQACDSNVKKFGLACT